MTPLRAWASETDIAISGYRYTKKKKKVECYIILPIEILDRIKNDQDQVALSQLKEIRTEELSKVDIVDKQVPSGFRPLTKEENIGHSIYADKHLNVNPQYTLALPFTLVFDVITLPVQIAFTAGMSDVH